ncbi:MAG: methyl-accepting chemotaxis protein, partial [Candidatus Acidiferrales bacterium]
MKARLSSTVWLLVFWVTLALFGVLGLSYYAGAHSVGQGASDVSSVPGGANGALFGAALLALIAAISVVYVLSKRVLTPVEELAKFSERVVSGDVRARVEIDSNDEFGFIAENFNRSAAKVAHAVTNQQAQDSLQRSITDLLNTINQVARGDLTIRGKVTNDALGNVVDSVNFMLDNFTKVLERVRKAAVDVSGSANQILDASDDMTAGATQQDQEITNTSSAVEELTVSMKQVSNNAEASAEAARRALDAAEQGNRAVRDTLEGMQRIRSSVQATAKKIKSLGDRSLEISEIINVINDITE